MVKAELKRHNNSTPEETAEGWISANWWGELILNMDLQGVAADFYLFYAVKDGSPYLQARFDEYAQLVAKQLAVYLDAAVGGELRHQNFANLTNNDNRSIARGKWRAQRIEKGKSLLEEGRNNFYNGKWSSGFGGKAWGNVADVLLSHLNGDMSATLFVDQALALEHNNGCVFNKIYNYWPQEHMKIVLDANLKEDWTTLLKYASPWAVEMFKSWLVEEEEVEVELAEWSKPIYDNNPSDPVIKVGTRVVIGEKSKAKKLRGTEGIVKALRSQPKPKNTKPTWKPKTQAKLIIDGKPTWVITDNLDMVATKASNGFEYISDEE